MIERSFSFWRLILLSSISLLAVSCQQGSPIDQDTEQAITAASETNKTEGPSNEELRIISLSGFLTELLYTTGYGEQIVGRDVTSIYPEALQHIPNLGHVTQLNVEGILELKPTHILIEEDQVRQAEAITQLKGTDIQIIPVPTSHHFSNSIHALEILGKHLTLKEDIKGQLANQITQDSLALSQNLSKQDQKPKVLFIYARGAGRLSVAGTETAAADIIEKSGGVNAIQSFEQFQTLTPEALIEASPDAILMFDSGLASLDGKEGLAQIPGIAQTSAFQNDQIITMNGHYLLSFGPRAAQAANDLAQQLYSK